VAAQRHLPNAPITEAVIDIQVTPVQGETFEEIEPRLAAAGIGYPQSFPLWTTQIGFVFNPATAQPIQPANNNPATKIGLRFQSEDNRYIAALKMNGLTVSRLAPYETWEKLETEARRLWGIYLEHFRVATVTRVATRYINNLMLPMKEGQEFSVFVDTFLNLPASMPQSISTFLQQFQILDRESGNSARLALAWDGRPIQEGRIPIVLDIDVFREQLQMDPRDNEIWELLNSMRALKNRCFFGALTEQAVQVYA
jgi:uncharacterized protein (TIGR04255 family)